MGQISLTLLLPCTSDRQGMFTDVISTVFKCKPALWQWYILQEYQGKEMKIILALLCIVQSAMK